MIEATQQSEEEFLEEQEQDKEFELDDAPMRTRVAAGLADLSLICWITVALHEGLQLSEWSGLAGPIALGFLWLLVLVKDTAQNTPGRWLMGLSIIQEDGTKVPRSQALRRNLLLSIPVIGWTAALVWAQLDPRTEGPEIDTRIGSQLESAQRVSPALLGGIGASPSLEPSFSLYCDWPMCWKEGPMNLRFASPCLFCCLIPLALFWGLNRRKGQRRAAALQ